MSENDRWNFEQGLLAHFTTQQISIYCQFMTWLIDYYKKAIFPGFRIHNCTLIFDASTCTDYWLHLKDLSMHNCTCKYTKNKSRNEPSSTKSISDTCMNDVRKSILKYPNLRQLLWRSILQLHSNCVLSVAGKYIFRR